MVNLSNFQALKDLYAGNDVTPLVQNTRILVTGQATLKEGFLRVSVRSIVDATSFLVIK